MALKQLNPGNVNKDLKHGRALIGRKLKSHTERKMEVKARLDSKPTDTEEYKKELAEAIKNAWEWTKPKLKAARMVADGRYNPVKVAEAVGISTSGLANWRRHPAFIEKVEKNAAAWKSETLTSGIALKEHRIRALDDIAKGLQDVVAARQKFFKGKKTPGGETGLVIEQFKFRNRKDGSQQKLVESSIDTGLVNAIRGIQVDVAKELNQLKDNVEVTQTTIIREYDGDTSQV